jgi:hypothetical protein
VDEGFNPTYGARPLRRAIMRLIEDCLAERILVGDIKEGDVVIMDVDPDGAIAVLAGGWAAGAAAAAAGRPGRGLRSRCSLHDRQAAGNGARRPPSLPTPKLLSSLAVVVCFVAALCTLWLMPPPLLCAGDKKMRQVIDATPAGIA